MEHADIRRKLTLSQAGRSPEPEKPGQAGLRNCGWRHGLPTEAPAGSFLTSALKQQLKLIHLFVWFSFKANLK